MSPGPLTTCSRGGFGYGRAPGFTPHAAGFSRGNRAYGAAGGRTFNGHRQRFAVATDPANGQTINLGDNEVATVTVNADGSTTISIENKPAAPAANGNGGNGVQVETDRLRSHLRGLAGRLVGKMSWEKDPATGAVTFVPDANEVIDVDGDATMAVVSAVPTPPAGQ